MAKYINYKIIKQMSTEKFHNRILLTTESSSSDLWNIIPLTTEISNDKLQDGIFLTRH